MQLFKALGLAKVLAFKAVYEKRSVKAAAEELNITAPAVSVHISDLEAKFDVKLFDRAAAGFEPTESGDAFYECTVAYLKAISKIAKPKNVNPYIERSSFTIGGDNYYRHYLSTFVISAISSWDQAMVITHGPVQNLADKLIASRMDAYIFMGEPETHHSLKTELLFRESYCLCVGNRTTNNFNKDYASSLPIIANTDVVKRLPREYRARVAHVFDDKTVPANLFEDANYAILVPSTMLLSSHDVHVIGQVPSVYDNVYLTYFDDCDTNKTRRLLVDVIVNALSTLSAQN